MGGSPDSWQMSCCRRKEAELLEFTRKLTDKNVTLQVRGCELGVRAEVKE